MIYALTRDGCHQQKEGIDDSLIDVARMLVEPPPRAGVGQLAELLLERREARLVVGHGVLAGAGVGVGLLFGRASGSRVGVGLLLGRGQPYVPAWAARCSFDDRCTRAFDSVPSGIPHSDPSVLSGIQTHS